MRDFKRFGSCASDEGIAPGAHVGDMVRPVARRNQLGSAIVDRDRVVRAGVQKNLSVLRNGVRSARLLDLHAGLSGPRRDDTGALYSVDDGVFGTARKAMIN